MITSSETSLREKQLKADDWSLADLIDFELFLEEDQSAEHSSMAARDIVIKTQILKKVEGAGMVPCNTDSPESRRWWFRHWLENRRQQLNNPERENSVGYEVQSALKSVGGMLCLIGGGLGLISILGLLAAPMMIDVLIALALYLVPQVILLTLSVLAALRHHFGWQISPPFVLQFLISKVVTPLFDVAWRELTNRPGHNDYKLRFQAAVGLLLGRAKVHRASFGWPLFAELQKAGAAFAAMIVITMIPVCLLSHHNFGWSTDEKSIDAKIVHRVTQVMAFPWSWVIPEGKSYPTLDEVKRSQFFKASSVPSEFAKQSTWWRFICLSLFTYALIPRLILLIYSRYRGNHALKTECFNDSRSNKLWRRLRSEGSWSRPSQVDNPMENKQLVDPKNKPAISFHTVPHDKIVVFTELDEFLNSSVCEEVGKRVEQRMGYTPFQNEIKRCYSPKDQESCINYLACLKWENDVPRVLCLFRAIDPIVENSKYFVEQCLSKIGNNGHLTFGLLGREHLISDSTDPEDVKVWEEYANILKRRFPNVETENLTNP